MFAPCQQHKNLKSRLRNNQTTKKTNKRLDFKAKKLAYIQETSAYEAYMYDTSDEEAGCSSCGKDEESNKSTSTFSSEGSKAA